MGGAEVRPSTVTRRWHNTKAEAEKQSSRAEVKKSNEAATKNDDMEVHVHEDVHVSVRRRRRRRLRNALLPAAALLLSASSPDVVGADQQDQCAEDTAWLDQLFPIHSLDGAWESNPLLSTVYKDDSRTKGLAPIPTLVVPSATGGNDNDEGNAPVPPHQSHRQRFASLLSLFSVNGVETVLGQPGMKHHTDYKMVRKIVRNGEEWEGSLPYEELGVEEARRAFEVGGFSLVINALQKRWGQIAALTRQVQKEAGSTHVSVNCYLTPDTHDSSGGRASVEVDADGHVARRHAFENHWDWMDVIVLQISGTKLWSVSRSPAEYLSTRDLKTKPTLDQVDRYLSPVNERTQDLSDQGKYDDFLLRPGDALYIPRGFMHNASTISPSIIEAQHGGLNAYDDEFTNELMSGPSLHLTLGLEVAFEATYEALVHHALAAWFATQNRDNELDKYVLSAKECANEKSKGVQWTTYLHLVVGDMSRRGCRSREEDGCILRKSVPRGILWEDRFSKQMKQDDRKEVLLSTVEAMQKYAHTDRVVRMANQILHEQYADGNHNSDFYVPVIDVHNRLDEMRCIARRAGDLVDEEDVRRQFRLFREFVGEKGDGILSPFENHLESIRKSNIQRDDANLLRAGQAVPVA